MTVIALPLVVLAKHKVHVLSRSIKGHCAFENAIRYVIARRTGLSVEALSSKTPKQSSFLFAVIDDAAKEKKMDCFAASNDASNWLVFRRSQ